MQPLPPALSFLSDGAEGELEAERQLLPWNERLRTQPADDAVAQLRLLFDG